MPVVEVLLPYGRGQLSLEVPADAVVAVPGRRPALPDQRGAVVRACREPATGPPLDRLVGGTDRVAVVFPDLTRPMPNPTVLPPLLAHLGEMGVGPDRLTLLCATGTHRAATAAEMAELVGPEVWGHFDIHDHQSEDPDHVEVGRVDAVPVLLDRAYVEAGVRIATGFVEPHFFAGFSGGPKAVCPGLAATETILEAHSPARIGHPAATWGVIDQNPVQQFIRQAVELAPLTFSIDVTIDDRRRLTGVYSGPLPEGHRRACEAVAEVGPRVEGLFDVVVTTNSGFPLDLNLYQAVKGMAAAARVLRPGGTILMAAACPDGIPAGSAFDRLLSSAEGLEALLDPAAPAEKDRWEAQVLAQVLMRGRVGLYSDGLTPAELERAGIEPVADLQPALAEAMARCGDRLCVIPQGPLTLIRRQ